MPAPGQRCVPGGLRHREGLAPASRLSCGLRYLYEMPEKALRAEPPTTPERLPEAVAPRAAPQHMLLTAARHGIPAPQSGGNEER